MGKRGNVALSFVLELLISVVVLIALIRASNFIGNKDEVYARYYAHDLEMTIKNLKLLPQDVSIHYKPIYQGFYIVKEDINNKDVFAFRILSENAFSTDIFLIEKKSFRGSFEINMPLDKIKLNSLVIMKKGNIIELFEGSEVCYYSQLSKDKALVSVVGEEKGGKAEEYEFETLMEQVSNNNIKFVGKSEAQLAIILRVDQSKKDPEIVLSYGIENDFTKCFKTYLYNSNLKVKFEKNSAMTVPTLEVTVPQPGIAFEEIAKALGEYFKK